MKTILLTFIFGVFTTFGLSAQKKCTINKHYGDFISIQKYTSGNSDYLVKRIIVTDKKSCISELINNNIPFMDYLLTNFSSISDYDNLLKLNDSIELNNKYIQGLKKDSMFNSVMTDLVNKSIDKSISKDTISMDDLLNIAVKYFSIKKLTEEGYYVGKVCAGLNDIKKTEVKRSPFIEAFAFSSILNNYQGEVFSMYDEFVKELKDLYKVNLGIDKSERLLRAQGAIFFIMRRNENLKKMLLAEYEKKKTYLPFVLNINE